MDNDSRGQTTYCYENRHLPKMLLLRLQERKAKIRKFMLYVDGVLNDTEKDMLTLCELFTELENLSRGYSPAAACKENKKPFSNKRRRKVKFESTDDRCSAIENEKPVVPETVPFSSMETLPNEQSIMVVPETCVVEDNSHSQRSPQDAGIGEMLEHNDKSSNHEALIKQDESVIDSCLDETVGVELTQSKSQTNNQQQPGICGKKATVVDLQNMKSHRLTDKRPSIDHLDEHGELSVLTPVTSLLKTVMGGVNNPAKHVIGSQSDMVEMVDSCGDGGNKNQQKEGADTDVKEICRSKTTAHSPLTVSDDSAPDESSASCQLGDSGSINASYSPALFAEDDAGNDDETYFDDEVTEVASTSTAAKGKKVVAWPIGYSKSNRGSLVVEPATAGSRSSKRARQTRLDGFLAKATLQNSMDNSRHKAVISTKTLGSKKSSKLKRKPEALSLDSDSDSDHLDEINLELLKPRDSCKSPARKSSPQKPKQNFSNHPHDLTTENAQPPKPEGSSDRKRKYQIGEVVRGKARKHLTGYRCLQCYEYYRTLHLTEDEIQQRLNEVCRHRAVKPPMETPPRFWNMSIASLDQDG